MRRPRLGGCREENIWEVERHSANATRMTRSDREVARGGDSQ